MSLIIDDFDLREANRIDPDSGQNVLIHPREATMQNEDPRHLLSLAGCTRQYGKASDRSPDNFVFWDGVLGFDEQLSEVRADRTLAVILLAPIKRLLGGFSRSSVQRREHGWR